ncbi:MAG: hypothetical protein EU548_06460 [Promethearchaeota archaeon]|nr:MAG: hypothetical protein EU548_06460 [Candidatus Lokiarchaeota archaeon]
MIYQAIFNILDAYFKESELFNLQIEQYFKKKINNIVEINEIKEKNPNSLLKDMIDCLISLFMDMGMKKEELLDKAYDPSLKLKENIGEISTKKLYETKIVPLINEIIFEKICEYLVDVESLDILIELNEQAEIPIEFMVEIRDLKNLMEEYPEKRENLKKYVLTKKKVIDKFEGNKEKIENLERLKEAKDKLQIFYLVYRLIEFFNLHKTFNYESLGKYLKNHSKSWLLTLPLISLRNPDLYFCGLYLSKHIGLEINEEKVRLFILCLWKEIIDEYESPIIEGTSKLYYYLKSLRILEIDLGKERIENLINFDERFFEDHYLKDFETSKLIVILKICNLLNIDEKKIGSSKVQKLENEINKRITDKGIILFRDGLISSEATYYTIFYYYMKEELQNLKKLDLVESLVSRIHRNIEMITFSKGINYDLISELFYSCEALKLFNCIESKFLITSLARYLFPKKITKEILENEEFLGNKDKFWHKHIDRITGETQV